MLHAAAAETAAAETLLLKLQLLKLLLLLLKLAKANKLPQAGLHQRLW